MRNLPIDSTQIALLSSGKCMPKAEYAKLADGSSKRVPGAQAKESTTGMPLWIVDCYLDDDEEEGRAEIVGVTVASYERPEVKKFRPIHFDGLVASARVDGFRVAFSFRATGIAIGQVKAAA